ncbi:MAG TPA: ABC transporter substrate-binding protein [Candidatus Binatia bacterium]|nr:ABC transporter substrate-binding protein [Candidatus Binatia bacterium]
MKKSAAVLVLIFAAVLTLTAVGQAKTYVAYISDSPASSSVYWVAKDAGIFKKHGLDVELIFINGSTRGIQSLIAGDVSFSGGVGTAVINGKLAGGDIAIIQSLTNTLPYYIFGKPEIKSPEDLKGRSAAMHIPGTSADFALRLALKGVGLSLKDIKGVTIGGGPARVAAVASGQLDFTVGTEGEKIRGEIFGLKVVIDMAKLNLPFQFTCTVATRRMIRENPDLVQRMVNAMAEAVHYYKSNKDPVVKIMQKYSRGPSRAFFEEVFDSNKDLLVEDTYPTLEGLKATLEIQASWDPKAAKAKAEDFVDLRFVEELKKSGFIEKLYGKR